MTSKGASDARAVPDARAALADGRLVTMDEVDDASRYRPETGDWLYASR